MDGDDGPGSCFLTVQRATAVECALGPVAFTRPEGEELVVIRGTTLDIYACTQRLEHLVGGCINESVSCLLVAASKGSYDLLVLVTVSLQILVVRYDNNAKVLQLLASADAGNMVLGATARPASCGTSSCRRFVAVYLYSNIVAIADLAAVEASFEQNGVVDLKTSQKMFYVDVKEQVACLDFLTFVSEATPQLVALHAREDACGAWEDGQKVLCVHSVDLQKKRAQCLAKPELPAARGVANVPGRQYLCCDLIAAVPHSAGTWAASGAVLAVGAGYVRLFNAELQQLIAVRGTQACSSMLVKVNDAGNRWLVAGSLGDLYLLRLEGGCPVSVTVQCMGVSVPASAVATWQQGDYAFIGSQVSDSEVLHFHAVCADAPATASTAAGRRRKNLEDAFEVMETWTNLGPITDFCTKELGSGRLELISCSGAGSNLGSLRFIQVGIPLEDLGSSGGSLGSVLGLWPLGCRYLVLSRPGRTEVLQIEESEVEEFSLCLRPFIECGLRLSEETLFCCSIADLFIQVTRFGALMLDPLLRTRGEWRIDPLSGSITAAVDGEGGLLVASALGDIFALDLHSEGGTPCSFVQTSAWRLAGEPSCLCSREQHLAAGLWSDELCIWHRQDFGLQTLALPTLPRSVAFSPHLQLFTGLCDGRVVLATKTAGSEWHLQRTVVVGMEPVKLLVLPAESEMGPKLPQEDASSERSAVQEQEMLLAISGNGSILQAQSQRVVQTPVCLPNMSHAAFFSHGLAGLHHCMAFISEERLLLARLRCHERMHVRSLPFPQAPRRIAYHQPTRICVAGCCDMSSSVAMPSPSRSRAQLQFVHSDTVSLLDTMTLGHDEMISSVVTVSFTGDPTVYVAVGTAVVLQSEPEPTRGQVRLLAPCPSSSSSEVALPPFRVAKTLEVQGAVYALSAFEGRLLGAVNNRLQLWELQGSQLVEVCRYSAGVIVLDLQTLGDLILVGDIMRSVTLMRFQAQAMAFETVAHDETSAWSTTVDMLSENHFLCAEDGGNLLSLRCGQRRSNGEAVNVLERVGRIHTGEFMNRFQRSTLRRSMSRPGSAFDPTYCTIWASASGAFGWVLPVEQHRFLRLLKLQEFIASELKPMLSQKWCDARLDLQGERVEHEGFLDGDLLKRFLMMPEEKQQALAARARRERLDGLDDLDAGDDPLQELLEDLEMLSR
ncbi:unnamed protein product [Cladocopium goreaui]|uniref:DNA damage-binding protein 1 n=1 Tax=Cladocopium goreaui TaxID=2562237 RepID=A0A9P1GPX2_9DINO|nr:unnamed protein product [Cladocopium goreaui]